jgi:endonuclease YncB( thermonuclease family)
VVDGDTIRLQVDLGYRIYVEQSIRLAGIRAPLLFRVTDAQEREAGEQSRFFVIDWLEKHNKTCAYNGRWYDKWPLMLHTETGDGFGRYIGQIYCKCGENLNDAILKSGHAKPFDKVK